MLNPTYVLLLVPWKSSSDVSADSLCHHQVIDIVVMALHMKLFLLLCVCFIAKKKKLKSTLPYIKCTMYRASKLLKKQCSTHTRVDVLIDPSVLFFVINPAWQYIVFFYFLGTFYIGMYHWGDKDIIIYLRLTDWFQLGAIYCWWNWWAHGCSLYLFIVTVFIDEMCCDYTVFSKFDVFTGILWVLRISSVSMIGMMVKWRYVKADYHVTFPDCMFSACQWNVWSSLYTCVFCFWFKHVYYVLIQLMSRWVGSTDNWSNGHSGWFIWSRP